MKINRKQYSLRKLRTFCVAARHLSFRVAAEELFVTSSAVSHQIKSLEQELGSILFRRDQSGVEMTEVGRALFDDVDELMQKLGQTMAKYSGQLHRHAIRISVQPFFASELFVPRLASFTASYPHIDLRLDTTNEERQKHPPSADVSIRVFRRAPPNLEAVAFFPLRLLPACSKTLRQRIDADGGPRSASYPIIVHSHRKNDWQQWSDSAGITLPEPSSIIELDSTQAIVHAAEQGLGVALVPVPVSANRFTSGQLVQIDEHEATTPERYYFVCTKQAARTRSVQDLRTWVLKNFTPLA